MLNLKRLLWTFISTQPTLLAFVPASSMRVAYQVGRMPKPGIAIQQQNYSKKIPVVSEILTGSFVLSVWSTAGDEECDVIADALYLVLDQKLASNLNVFIYENDVTPMAGPYWDEPEHAWRKDLTLEVIVREK